MEKLEVLLSHPLDEDVGRNEKIRTRIEKLRDDYEINIHVVRDGSYENVFLNFLDIMSSSIKESLDIIKESFNLDVTVWTMNSPAFLHITGVLSKIFGRKVEWIAEFRDAMCEEPFYSHKTIGRRIIKSLLERPTVWFADKITTVKGFQGSINYLNEKYPEFQDKFHELPLCGIEENKYDIEPRNFDKFTIVYGGRFYEDWIEPMKFIEGFKEFVETNNLDSDDIQVKFFCKGWKSNYQEKIENLSLNNYFDIDDYIPQSELFSVMKGANVLLYIHGKSHSRSDMIHSKFYDYSIIDTPILSLSDKDTTVSYLIEKYDLGVSAVEDDIHSISKSVKKIYNGLFKNNKGRFQRSKHDNEFKSIVSEI